MLTRSAFDTRTESRRRQAERNPMRPAVLLPPDAFRDRPASEDDFRRLCAPGTPRGRHALAVQRRLASGCAGWKLRPTSEEFYDTLRQLVAALHRANFAYAPRIHKINRWAAKS